MAICHPRKQANSFEFRLRTKLNTFSANKQFGCDNIVSAVLRYATVVCPAVTLTANIQCIMSQPVPRNGGLLFLAGRLPVSIIEVWHRQPGFKNALSNTPAGVNFHGVELPFLNTYVRARSSVTHQACGRRARESPIHWHQRPHGPPR